MDFETLIVDHAEGIATIQFNRPQTLNAMNAQLWVDLKRALDTATAAQEIKAIIITGKGRAFSSGADLKESKDRTLSAYRRYLESLQSISRQLIHLEKPLIAAINGYALGSGYELALACDLRIAAEDALIGSPEVKVNSSVTGGALRLLQDLVGPAKAKELLFTGENVTGKEAERIGLVNKAVPAGQLLDEARSWAKKIAANSGFSIKMIKKGLHMAQGEASLDAIMDFEIEACLACVATRERQASLQAFENRKKSK
jgi:enoyl-CoA hydratase